MKVFLRLCCALLLLAVADLPIGYYTILRIIITIGACLIILNDYKGEIGSWIILFGIVALIFNPLFPIYLNDKDAWLPIDLLTALLFGIKSFTLKSADS